MTKETPDQGEPKTSGPEAIADEALDQAAGGLTGALRTSAGRKRPDGFMSADGGMDPTLKDQGDGFIAYGEPVGT